MERHLSKYVGAMVMYLIAKRSKKKYGIDDERLALYAALNSWADAVGDKRMFLGGHEPNKADLSVFGVLRAMHGLDTYNDVMRETKIWPWFRCMTDRVGSSSRTASKQLEITVKE
uniref:GST C-terminal domain-containing protein n=1 Tax=Peronospora matthiolae TaxID=2874970 RepID=A0AAV1UF05_9STRA